MRFRTLGIRHRRPESLNRTPDLATYRSQEGRVASVPAIVRHQKHHRQPSQAAQHTHHSSDHLNGQAPLIIDVSADVRDKVIGSFAHRRTSASSCHWYLSLRQQPDPAPWILLLETCRRSNRPARSQGRASSSSPDVKKRTARRTWSNPP